MDQLLVDRPAWLDWAWTLRVLDQEVRVTGEEVRPAEGMVATACLVAEEPLVVTVTEGPAGGRRTGGGGHLAVTPPAPALGEFVTRRFDLDLDEHAVDRALERSTLARLFERDGWVRRPATAMLWSYCLVFLCGGDPDAPSVRRIFAELGRPWARPGERYETGRRAAAGTWRRRSPVPGMKPRRVSHSVIQSGAGWPAGTTL